MFTIVKDCAVFLFNVL